MKTLLLSLFFCTYFVFANAQEETTAYKTSVASLQASFNQEDHESIFTLFSEEMKQYLPLPNTISFFDGLRAQTGEMNQTEFEGYANSSTVSYKTTFDNGIFTLLISLNEKGEIAGLLIKPYEEPSKKTDDAYNNLISDNSEITQEQVEIIFNKLKSFPDQTQAAIALIKDGKVSYFGAKREKDSFVELSNSAKAFEIGSITKVFTATLLADFVIDGKVKLEEPIHTYLGFDFNQDHTISFLSLANHSSGLPRLPTNLNLFQADPKNPYAQYDKAKLESYLKESLQLKDTTNTKFEYSNLGAGLLAHVLGEIDNSSFEEMLQERIFTKYEMNNSSTEKNKIQDKLVIGLDMDGNETSNWDLAALKGAGAILSTVEDLSKFAIAQFSSENNELKMTQKSTLEIGQNREIGLGWLIINDENYLFHNGGTGGYTSSIVLDVNSRNGVIMLSNVSASHPKMTQIDQLSFELMESLK